MGSRFQRLRLLSDYCETVDNPDLKREVLAAILCQVRYALRPHITSIISHTGRMSISSPCLRSEVLLQGFHECWAQPSPLLTHLARAVGVRCHRGDLLGFTCRNYLIFALQSMHVAGPRMAKATSRVAAVELRGFRSVQMHAKVEFANANLTGIVGPNGKRREPCAGHMYREQEANLCRVTSISPWSSRKETQACKMSLSLAGSGKSTLLLALCFCFGSSLSQLGLKTLTELRNTDACQV